ncbi:MAG: tetratricopeptide repeat protein [Bacteroidia bacterium]|nr:tetratricopeptide repeat protein [Bacteroidia bacterium]
MIRFVLFFWLTINPITYISTINQVKEEAKIAYQQKNYLLAIQHYRSLTDEYSMDHPSLFLNLAHAYYQIRSFQQARYYYQKVLAKGQASAVSTALNQLGLIEYGNGKREPALRLFKQAIKKHPANNHAPLQL